MKNQIKIMMMFVCLYSSMGLGSTTKVPVPQSLKPKNWQEWFSDWRGTTSPCARVQEEFVEGVCLYGDKFSPEHKAFYVACMKSDQKYRDWSTNKDDVYTPLMYFASEDLSQLSEEQVFDVVEMLIKGGVDLNAQNDDSGTALDFAILGRRSSLVKALVLAKATYTKTDMNRFGNILKRRAEREKNKDFDFFDAEHPTQHQDMLDFFNNNMAPAK